MRYLAIAATIFTMTAVAAEADQPAGPLPLAILLDAAQAALASCAANGYHVTVTVLDPDMSRRIVLRGDAAPERSVELGYRKAYTAVKTGMSSRDFSRTVSSSAPPPAGPAPVGPPPLPGPVNGDPNLITWPGGAPIRVNGTLVGAMSVAGAPGGDKDEGCVNAGLAGIAGATK